MLGEAADPKLIAGIRTAVSREGILGVGEIITIHKSPDQIVAAINADFDNRLSAADVERIIDAIERDLQQAYPMIYRVYVRPHEDAGIGRDARGLSR